MIEIENLSKKFGEQLAIDMPKLCISQGELVGLVGNNGAGKTTLFRLMLDLYQADSGCVKIKGQNVAQSEDWKIYTGAFVDNGFLIEFLTPEEYFHFIGKCHDLSELEVDERLADFEKFMNGEILGKKKYIRAFSAGNKQKVGIIGAMMLRPELLILDEPFNYLDPSSQVEMKRLLLEYNKRYTMTMILSSHNLEHITDIASRMLLLERGKLLRNLPNEQQGAYGVLKSYFEQ